MAYQRPVKITAQMVDQQLAQRRDLDVQRREYGEFSQENNKLLYAAKAQEKVETRRRATHQSACQMEQQYEERTREEHYQRRISELTNTQNDALAIEMDKEKNDEVRRAREIQRICEDAPELRDLERALKIAYMNKDRAAQHKEKIVLAAHEAARIQMIEDSMELDRVDALQHEADKIEARKKVFEDQRIVLQRQIKEREEHLKEAQKQEEMDKQMVDDIVRKINEDDVRDNAKRKHKQDELAAMVRAYEEQRKVELAAKKRAEKEEEDKIAEYNRFMDSRNAGVAAKKQAKKDEEDRILAKIVEETERQRKADEEFNNLRDMLWEEELEAKKRQMEEDKKKQSRQMKVEMMDANSRMLDLKLDAKKKEQENEARMVVLMRKKFAEDDAAERAKESVRREQKTHHMTLIERQRLDRQEMYDREKSAETQAEADMHDKETYRKRVIQEARKRLLEEHAAKLEGFMPGGAFGNKEEYELFQNVAQQQNLSQSQRMRK
jgi:hypothetical protein